MKPVYLDHNATTPVRAEVVEAMLPMFREDFGNPSSAHACGGGPRQRREEARARVAALLGCCPVEVVFTSGGTESDNHAIKGAAFALRERGTHIVTSRVEHHAVLHTCRWLERRLGFTVTQVDGAGRALRVEMEDGDGNLLTLLQVKLASTHRDPLSALDEVRESIASARAVFSGASRPAIIWAYT